MIQMLAYFQPFALECVFPGVDYLTYAYIAGLTPPVLYVLMYVSRKFLSLLASALNWIPLRHLYWDSYIKYVFYYSCYFIYIHMARVSLNSFNCEHEGEVHYLAAAPYINCRSADYKLYAVVAMVAVLVFVIGIPLLFAYKVHRATTTAASKENRAVYGFLYSPLKTTNSFWNVFCVMGRKLAVVGVSSLIDRDSVLVPFFLFMVLSISFGAQVWVRPFREKFDNTLETGLMLLACISYFARVTTFLRGVRDAGQFNSVVLTTNIVVGVVIAVGLVVRSAAKKWNKVSNWLTFRNTTTRTTLSNKTLPSKNIHDNLPISPRPHSDHSAEVGLFDIPDNSYPPPAAPSHHLGIPPRSTDAVLDHPYMHSDFQEPLLSEDGYTDSYTGTGSYDSEY